MGFSVVYQLRSVDGSMFFTVIEVKHRLYTALIT